MPQTKVVFYKEDDGSVPILEWLDSLSPKALDKCTVRIERLQEMGHELRRPEGDFLRDGIYELRVWLQHVNYRMLYFVHGRTAAVVSHGLVKEAEVLPRKLRRQSRGNKNSRKTLRSYAGGGVNMPKKRKATSEAVEILHRRYYEGRPERLSALEEARAEDQLARKIYELRESKPAHSGDACQIGWNDRFRDQQT